MTEAYGLEGIWESLSEFLTIATHVSGPSGDGRCTVDFTITNAALSTPQTPDVVFDEVRLTYGTAHSLETVTFKNLACGASVIHQCSCSLKDLIELQYSVDGRVSPNALFEFRGRSSHVPRIASNVMPPAVYLTFLAGVNVIRWIEESFSAIQEPGPDTTLAEIQALRKKLHDLIDEIHQVKDQVQQIMGFVDLTRRREEVLAHKRLFDEYVAKAAEALASLDRTLHGPDTRAFRSVKTTTIASLKAEGDRLDQATEALKTRLSS